MQAHQLPASAWRPARAKVRFAMFPKGQVVHHVTGVQSALHDGRIHYKTEWLCSPNGGAGTVLVRELAAQGTECHRCADVVLGPVIYRLYDKAGALLYIGATGGLATRLRRHKRHPFWGYDIASHTYERYADMRTASEAEALAIRTEHPMHNVNLLHPRRVRAVVQAAS